MTRTTDRPRQLAAPLREPQDLDPLLDRIGDARVVCLGEASHGTHEFYAWRALVTRRLVEERGFDFVAVEGDWPDCYALGCCVTGEPGSCEDPRDVLTGFDRWPTWMWANEEVLEFARWLRRRNMTLPSKRRVGFYGLDVYSLWESLHAVLDYLREHHPEELEAAAEAARCLEPYAESAQAYARATWLVPTSCEVEVVTMLGDLLQRHTTAGSAPAAGRDAAFAAEQNARAAVGAEAYYRAMVRGGPESWNVRDRHMVDTLDRLLTHYEGRGNQPVRAVVWEHNTHIGDARFTDMHQSGMVNVGQLVREQHGEEGCVLVGFGSYRGSVIAADEWGRPTTWMTVPEARPESTESLLHESLNGADALFVFGDGLPEWAAEEREHRAIGVVYRPSAERWGNYVPTVLGRRYDAFLWLDETTALHPLHGVSAQGEEMETYPFGG
ncbi:MAG TPA: erythromycin esterase family protein [Marmoricola sp.]|nr:erythromycin esterase family protein [Marmoricola sp.]